jgi:hypothetical protein
LLPEADFEPAALVDERGCRRDIRSNGWIVLCESSLFRKTGPAEETDFLRSVRISGPQFHRAQSPFVESGPDVFADALVPPLAQMVPGASVFEIPLTIPIAVADLRASKRVARMLAP